MANKRLLSEDKINMYKKKMQQMDPAKMTPVNILKRDTVLRILSSDNIDFDDLVFSNDCPPKYDENAIALCNYIDTQSGVTPCKECWMMNLSDKKEFHVSEDKRAVISETYKNEERFKALEEYESLHLTPAQMKQILDKLDWDTIRDFDLLMAYLDEFNPGGDGTPAEPEEKKMAADEEVEEDDSKPASDSADEPDESPSDGTDDESDDMDVKESENEEPENGENSGEEDGYNEFGKPDMASEDSENGGNDSSGTSPDVAALINDDDEDEDEN